MYERCVKITDDMCEAGVLTALSLFRLLSDIMAENAESYGAGKAYHDARNRLWVLLEYDIAIARLPKSGERVHIGTLPYSFWKVYGYRVYRVRGESGESLVSGNGKFTLIDTENRRIVRPDAAMLALFKDALPRPQKLDFSDEPSALGTPIFKTQETICEHHLDINRHVNNAEYVGIAEKTAYEHLESLNPPRRIRVWYKRETKRGDKLVLKGYRIKDGLLLDMFKDDTLHARVYFAGVFHGVKAYSLKGI